MSLKEVLWEIPATWLQEFDRGKTIFDNVPARLGLQAGDRIEYAGGATISGTAEVVNVSNEPVRVSDWDAVIGEGDDPPEVIGSRCGFRKLS
jgi:hypothetical protein